MVIKLDNRLGPDLTPKPAAAHKHQHRSAGTIPTGPLYGLPKRVKTDRKRAIDRDQITNIVNAFAFSEHQRLALNGGLVVTWRASHLFDGDNWAQLQTQLLDSASRFLYRQGVTTAFFWTRERVTGHGAHTHIMIHLGGEPKIVCSKLRNYLRQRLQIEPSGLYISHGRYGMLNPQMRAGQLLYNLK